MSQPAFDLLHRGVQEAIWKMGWKEFQPIQVEAIHQVLEGSQHLVIMAQTAGGKTEAAFLPIISQIAQSRQPSIQALYIGPLKALINDQFGRLERLCAQLEIPVHRWHGDVTASRKRELRQSPSGILLITPESLESNFINYGNQVPRIYQHLQFVVIDELHSFLDNVRGIHLLSLLSRLLGATGANPRMIGLSATLGDPNAARAFLSPDEPDGVKLITDPNSTREIRFGIKTYFSRPMAASDELLEPRIRPAQALQIIQQLSVTDLQTEHLLNKDNAPELTPTELKPGSAVGDELDEIADDVLKCFIESTNLVFVNSKATIERLADKLHERVRQERLPFDPFVVHHGSLSKELREEAEELLKDPAATTAICSSTLEMGIDIGAVRAVGQVDPPWSVSSMVQRLGRSGRREGEAAVMRMYVREDCPNYASSLTDLLYPDLLRAVALTRLMLSKWLEPASSNRLHLSTLIHQVLSCLKQTGGMHPQQLHQTLIHKGPFRKVDAQQFATLLRGLGAKALVEQIPTGELILAPLGEKITSNFDFYAAFQGTEEYFVRFRDEEIGSLPADRIPPIGEMIILAGRRWRVETIEPTEKTVYVAPTRGGRAPVFGGSGGELHPRVAEEMHAVLLATDEPRWLDEDGKILLRAARHVTWEAGLLRGNVIFKPNIVQWFPWSGTRCLRTLQTLATFSKIPHEVDILSISYRMKSRDAFFDHLRDIVQAQATPSDLAALLPAKLTQKFDAFLPEPLLNFANGCDQLDLNHAREAANTELSAVSQG